MPKPLQRQHRTVQAQIRATPDGVQGRFLATVLRYNVVDDYDTAFAPGVFDASLAARMPRIVWAHDWSDPLGRWTGRDLSDDSALRLVGEMDDFDAVPQARRAWAQMESGTIDQFSVGFMPEDALPAVIDGEEVLLFTRGRLDEVSLVLVGAVPGTELLAMRSHPIIVRDPQAGAVVDVEVAGGLLVALASGEVTLAEALATAQSQAAPATDPPTDPTEPPAGEPAAEPPAEQDPEDPPADPPAEQDPPASGEQQDPEQDPADPPAEQDPEPVEDPELDAELEAALELVDQL